MKSLTIIADIPHFKKSDGLYSYEPYVFELRGWSELFDDITLLSQTDIDSSRLESLPLSKLPDNVNFIENSLKSGSGFLNNCMRLLQLPFIFIRLWIFVSKCHILHTRAPGVSSAIANFINKFYNKPCVVKWATIFQPMEISSKIIPLERRILMSPPSKTRVLIYGTGYNDRHISYFPALAQFSIEPIERKVHLNKVVNIVYVGRLFKYKEPDKAVLALSQYSEAYPEIPFNFHIVGDGPEYMNITTSLKKSKIRNYHLHGRMSWKESMEILRSMDVVIVPSRFEGWCKVINEAYHYGVIPLVCDLGNASIPLKFLGEPAGFIYKYDLSDFNIKLNEIINADPRTLNLLRDRGKQINEQMTFSQYMAGIRNIYNKIIHD